MMCTCGAKMRPGHFSVLRNYLSLAQNCLDSKTHLIQCKLYQFPPVVEWLQRLPMASLRVYEPTNALQVAANMADGTDNWCVAQPLNRATTTTTSWESPITLETFQRSACPWNDPLQILCGLPRSACPWYRGPELQEPELDLSSDDQEG